MNIPAPKLAVFISGTGTNLQALIDAQKKKKLEAQIALVVSSSPTAQGLGKAEREGIETFVFQEKEFASKEEATNALLSKLRGKGIGYIALAGYLKIIAAEIISEFGNKIINIHPALLPKYGGKGMYGIHVHEAVIAAHDKESGVTIHLVDEKYDHGRILIQIRVPVYDDDTPGLLQQRILKEEHKHYPIMVNKLVKGEI
ncbi:MAG TPA: phosphoribosylglycinamide formyltransferase [candidate division Zixibacteria bacterium]|nr:phosphoribosylglycinamide formyltransferase [candidate division Zixibacteria bacterium]